MNTEIQAVGGSSEAKAKPFNVAFIGCGGIAQQHMNILTKIPGVKCVAGCDIRQEALDNWKTKWGVDQLYKDYKQLIKEAKKLGVDAVSICTPNGFHSEPAILALNAGLHVLVEKPPAMSAKEAAKMVEASKKAKKELVIGFQHRYEPRSKALRDMVEGGQFGKILYVRAQALRRRGIPNWGVFGRKELQGGGPMIDIGVHILETAHSIIGTPRPVSATGNCWTYYGNQADKAKIVSQWPNWDTKTYTVEDLAVGMIRFDTGTMLTIEASFVAHLEKDIFNIQIMGEKGGAIWDVSEIFMDYNNYMVSGKIPFVGQWDMWKYKMQHFVEVCRDGRKNECPGEHGLMVQKMLDGVYASAAKGAEVKID